MIGYGANYCLCSNNILNLFMPLGDRSLMRMVNLQANAAQRGTDPDLIQCFKMLPSYPAALLVREGYSFAAAANLFAWDAKSPSKAVAAVTPALLGVKRCWRYLHPRDTGAGSTLRCGARGCGICTPKTGRSTRSALA